MRAARRDMARAASAEAERRAGDRPAEASSGVRFDLGEIGKRVESSTGPFTGTTGEERGMRRVITGILAGVAIVAGAVGSVRPASAQMYVYPERGQSPQQQQRDRGECHVWAVQQSGYDPAAPPTVAVAAPPPPAGPFGGPSAVRGAARGAAVGAVGGAIGGDAGKGAAVGAATGALFGGMRRADQMAGQQQQVQAAQAQQQAMQARGNESYSRALSACLSGRGYTVR